MSEAPDLSKIVGLIMENPALIEQISSLTNKKSEDNSTDEKDTYSQDATPEVNAVEAGQILDNTKLDAKEQRNKLLSAMKPYLSEGRSRAIDTMISIADILGTMRGR